MSTVTHVRNLKVIRVCNDLIRELIFAVKKKQTSEVGLYLCVEVTFDFVSRSCYVAKRYLSAALIISILAKACSEDSPVPRKLRGDNNHYDIVRRLMSSV